MGFELKILFIVSIIITSVVANLPPQVPCYFIFGDSLVDNGNNNDLATTAKANYSPYGIDFPYGPTGRFCNGPNIADAMGEYLGFDESSPPFATASGPEILKGVNYGSGGAGILDETGQNLGERISMNMQLKNHEVTISHIVELLGSGEDAANYLRKCIYSVGMGNNDYINNYLMPSLYPTSKLFNATEFASLLIKQYYEQLKILNKLYAKKVILWGPGLVGCTPAEKAAYGTNGSACVNTINDDVQLFNDGFKELVDELNSNLDNANFTYINVFQLSSDDPTASGITVTNAPCCNVSSKSGKGLCTPNSIPCINRNMYAFYDGFHPTTAAVRLLVEGAYYDQDQSIAYPVDIQTLVSSCFAKSVLLKADRLRKPIPPLFLD